MTTQTEESPVLVLPSDEERVAQLKKKCDEYAERIRSYDRQHPNQHPHFRERAMALNICKMHILERLLRDGRVVAWDASREFVKEHEDKDEDSTSTFVNAWTQAWPVIKDYCETGGANVGDGTRLR